MLRKIAQLFCCIILPLAVGAASAQTNKTASSQFRVFASSLSLSHFDQEQFGQAALVFDLEDTSIDTGDEPIEVSVETRNFSYAFDAPRVLIADQLVPTRNRANVMHIDGSSQPQGHLYNPDGVDITDALVSGREDGVGASIDEIQEFQVLTNNYYGYYDEYAPKGLIINAVVRPKNISYSGPNISLYGNSAFLTSQFTKAYSARISSSQLIQDLFSSHPHAFIASASFRTHLSTVDSFCPVPILLLSAIASKGCVNEHYVLKPHPEGSASLVQSETVPIF